MPLTTQNGYQLSIGFKGTMPLNISFCSSSCMLIPSVFINSCSPKCFSAVCLKCRNGCHAPLASCSKSQIFFGELTESMEKLAEAQEHWLVEMSTKCNYNMKSVEQCYAREINKMKSEYKKKNKELKQRVDGLEQMNKTLNKRIKELKKLQQIRNTDNNNNDNDNCSADNDEEVDISNTIGDYDGVNIEKEIQELENKVRKKENSKLRIENEIEENINYLVNQTKFLELEEKYILSTIKEPNNFNKIMFTYEMEMFRLAYGKLNITSTQNLFKK